MKRISRSVAVYRRIYPLLGLLALLVVPLVAGTQRINGRPSLVPELLFFLVVVACLCGLHWLHSFFIADEVLDAGDHLIVRRGATSARVLFADIESVSVFPFSRPQPITLRFRGPSPFGAEIRFLPAVGFGFQLSMTFARSSLLDDLKERVDRAHH